MQARGPMFRCSALSSDYVGIDSENTSKRLAIKAQKACERPESILSMHRELELYVCSHNLAGSLSRASACMVY